MPGADVAAVGTHTFVLHAGKRPSRKAHLVYRVVDLAGGEGGDVAVRRLMDGISVTAYESQEGLIARQFFVGWRPVKKRPVHLRVRFDSLLVRRAMDPGCPPYDPNCPDRDESILLGQVTKAPGEWNVYVDTGGIWTQWLPHVLQAHDGQKIKGKQSVSLYVTRGKPWRLFVQTRECDFGSLGNAYSTEGVVSPCPHILEVGNTASDDQPGIAAVHFRSPEKSLGRHAINSSLEGSTCPPTNTKGCYRITFTVSRVRP